MLSAKLNAFESVLLVCIFLRHHYVAMVALTLKQGWQYGTVRLEFAYYVPTTLNCTVPTYRTSVQFLKRTAP